MTPDPGFTDSDLKVLGELQMHCSLGADILVDLIKQQKIESFALLLGSIHNALRRAAHDAQRLIDRTAYLRSKR